MQSNHPSGLDGLWHTVRQNCNLSVNTKPLHDKANPYISGLKGCFNRWQSDLRGWTIRASTMSVYDEDHLTWPVMTRRGVPLVSTCGSCNLHVCVGGGGEPLSCQSDDVQTRGQLVEKAWVTCAWTTHIYNSDEKRHGCLTLTIRSFMTEDKSNQHGQIWIIFIVIIKTRSFIPVWYWWNLKNLTKHCSVLHNYTANNVMTAIG